MDPLTHLPDAKSAVGSRAACGSDEYRTDYAGYAGTPDSGCPTNPGRAGAALRVGTLPSFPFLLPAAESK